ncbi:MAG TPA: ATP synthase subunit I [Rhodocyclaceae bacterium]|nr:ATP synthase subunit I [Rhodocyclaceae bacterium]
MIWQGLASTVLAVLGGVTVGSQGFVSAALGGAIGIAGVLIFALVSARRAENSASAVRIALRAEAAKVIVIVLLLWLAFAVYREMVVPAFFGAFMISVLLSGIAFGLSGD